MTGEAMLLTAGLALAAVRVFTLVLLPTLPFAITLGSLDRISARRPASAALLEPASAMIGSFAGPLLLWAAGFGPLLDVSAVFATGGPWDLDVRGFLELCGGRLPTAPWALVWAVAQGEAPADIARGTELLGLALLVLVPGPWLFARSRAGIAAGLRHLVLFAWGAYGSAYAGALLVWLANQLNFWSFLMLFLLSLIRRD